MKPRLILMDEPFASLDAIVRARVVRDVVALVEREKISVLLVTHDLEEALSLSDEVYLLSQGPRAHITQQYPVPIPRPRDPVHSRMHPAFSPLCLGGIVRWISLDTPPKRVQRKKVHHLGECQLAGEHGANPGLKTPFSQIQVQVGDTPTNPVPSSLSVPTLGVLQNCRTAVIGDEKGVGVGRIHNGRGIIAPSADTPV